MSDITVLSIIIGYTLITHNLTTQSSLSNAFTFGAAGPNDRLTETLSQAGWQSDLFISWLGKVQNWSPLKRNKNNLNFL